LARLQGRYYPQVEEKDSLPDLKDSLPDLKDSLPDLTSELTQLTQTEFISDDSDCEELTKL